jgi:zinc transporter, ZIP family
MVQTGAEVAVAFGLTILSGAATAIGASVVFFPGLLRLTTKKALSAACGIAGGVMLYVSFAEVFHESVAHFNTYGLKSGVAYSCATICFFSGIFLIMVR